MNESGYPLRLYLNRKRAHAIYFIQKLSNRAHASFNYWLVEALLNLEYINRAKRDGWNKSP